MAVPGARSGTGNRWNTFSRRLFFFVDGKTGVGSRAVLHRSCDDLDALERRQRKDQSVLRDSPLPPLPRTDESRTNSEKDPRGMVREGETETGKNGNEMNPSFDQMIGVKFPSFDPEDKTRKLNYSKHGKKANWRKRRKGKSFSIGFGRSLFIFHRPFRRRESGTVSLSPTPSILLRMKK